MPRSPSTSALATSRRPALHPRPVFAGLAAALVGLAAAPAFAQSSSCQDFRKQMEERRVIVEKLHALDKRKGGMDAKSACPAFGNLVTNGTTAVKWLETNKDWCQIPDQVIENIKKDHARAVDLRGQACKAAAQQAAMEKKAKEGGGSGLLGGDGLTGSYRMPQGAL
jgi:hypothetical protein